jgi:hypothetical protein
MKTLAITHAILFLVALLFSPLFYTWMSEASGIDPTGSIVMFFIGWFFGVMLHLLTTFLDKSGPPRPPGPKEGRHI